MKWVCGWAATDRLTPSIFPLSALQRAKSAVPCTSHLHLLCAALHAVKSQPDAKGFCSGDKRGGCGYGTEAGAYTLSCLHRGDCRPCFLFPWMATWLLLMRAENIKIRKEEPASSLPALSFSSVFSFIEYLLEEKGTAIIRAPEHPSTSSDSGLVDRACLPCTGSPDIIPAERNARLRSSRHCHQCRACATAPSPWRPPWCEYVKPFMIAGNLCSCALKPLVLP